MFSFVILWCAVSYHVSAPISGNAHDIDPGVARPLPTSTGSLGCIHTDRRESGQRHAATSRSTFQCCQCCPGTSATQRWTVFERSSGFPRGIGVQFGQTYPAHPKWRRLGQLVGWNTFYRPKDHCGAGCSEGSINWNRTKVEDDPDLGPVRRRGIYRPNGGDTCQVVPGICLHGRGFASGGRGPDLGTAVGVAEKAGDTGHGPLRGFCHLCAFWSKSPESLQVPDVYIDCDRLRDEGSSRAGQLHPVENLLQAFEDSTHNVGCCGLGGTPLLRDGNRKIGKDVSHMLAFDLSADEIARSAQANRLRSRLAMEIRAGRPGPEGFSPTRPWDFIYGALARDEGFWQAQVHTPALAWIASGSRGTPKTPAEQLAVGHLQGGLSAIAPVVENFNGTKDSHSPDASRRRKKRRGGEVQEVEKTKGLQKRPQQKKGEEQEERTQALRNATAGTMGMVSVAL